MVLEALISPITAEKKPWVVFFLGCIYSIVAVVLSLFIFHEQASITSVFLVSLLSVPLLYGVLKLEETKDLNIQSETTLLKEHSKFISFSIFLFLGFVITFSSFYIFLPKEKKESLFYLQIDTISQVRSEITGGFMQEFPIIEKIVINNLKVLGFCLLFSLIFGFGAIYILTWNASVVGTAIGNIALSSKGSTLTAFLVGLLRFSIHGIPEMIAYFIGALAGGIISMAIIRHDFKSHQFKHLFVDAAYLIGISSLILIAAAFLEVYISPLVG